MTYSVLFRHNAQRDAERAIDWYSLNALEQVDRFITDLDGTVEKIRDSPYLFRVLRGDARRASLSTFPYVVWFLCRENLNVIEVIAIVHQRQEEFQHSYD